MKYRLAHLKQLAVSMPHLAWGLKSKGTPLMLHSLHFKAPRKLESFWLDSFLHPC